MKIFNYFTSIIASDKKQMEIASNAFAILALGCLVGSLFNVGQILFFFICLFAFNYCENRLKKINEKDNQ